MSEHRHDHDVDHTSRLLRLVPSNTDHRRQRAASSSYTKRFAKLTVKIRNLSERIHDIT